MEVSVSELESKILVEIIGAVRLADSESLKNPFEKVLDESEKDVIVDLMKCPVMSSLGIGKIIFLNHRLEKQSRTMEIIGIHEHLLALFTSMKLHMVLKIRGN